jgi:hypothetical protein
VRLAALAVSSACLPGRRKASSREGCNYKTRRPRTLGEEGSKRGEGKKYYYRGPLFVIARVHILSLSLL